MMAVAWLAFASTASVAASPDETLTVLKTGGSYALSVPVSHLVMTIPCGDLATVDEPRSGASASPRYFHLADSKRGIVISGWFESARSYKGFDSFWKGETSAWVTNRLPAPKNTLILKVDNWEAAFYDLDVPGSNNTNIRSEWVQLGTWIDLHISVTTAEPLDTARATALTLLKSIRMTEVP
jgi:hypothetical protein